ncbi:unnamed protein product [Psylliodes chrysocephalus]|uniref:Uncharacterized protein n=1 Tax=Psylliodes chrysocephalus TaxID=3402493 RepID=A0A9P0G9G9_9CUCU|nr:unnamed protein product [Psylliodes chrysocephala]
MLSREGSDEIKQPTIRDSKPEYESVIDSEITAEIMKDYDKNKALIEEYRQSKMIKVETSPTLAPLEKILFDMIKPVLNEILYRIHCEDGFYKQKSSFNGLDYISEYCYNCNPKYPERNKSWTYIFDMPWVKDYLKEHPRPYYPKSLLMSKNTAAKYIQAHVRGYWVRKRSDLLEIRLFWKTIKFERNASGKLSITKNEE